MLTYRRRATLQSAHFNDVAYPHYRRSLELEKEGKHEEALAEFREAVAETHGHNFKVEVTFTNSDERRYNDWLIDDFKVAAILSEWDGKQLSVHPDFTSREARATTENFTAPD